MDLDAYKSVRKTPGGAALYRLSCDLLRIGGRDRASFLQGQISNDVLTLPSGSGMRACLLNNTGHLLADLVILAFDDHLLIETDPGRGDFVANTLERYRIREKVTIENVTTEWALVTLQSGTAIPGLQPGLGRASYTHADSAYDDAANCTVVRRDRVGAADGIDLLLPCARADAIIQRILLRPGMHSTDADTFDTLRIEAGRARWGAELSESIIPLEAGMIDALSFTKGCYVGQEIIARVRSRGHTNRTLCLLRLTGPCAPGDVIAATEGEQPGKEIGWVTSAAVSPEYGPIALGYVRNEHSASGHLVWAGIHRGRVVGDEGLLRPPASSVA
ncbi:MAG: glycine cleavage T C-terminal barrel domain-containing protein [Capsulimonadaceae bacterium]|nr:glycine cleavage T C-terminal barrel domain-containing protein [Capsulimonadaceae bacterium]